MKQNSNKTLVSWVPVIYTVGVDEVMLELRALTWTRQAVEPSVANLVNTVCVGVLWTCE